MSNHSLKEHLNSSVIQTIKPINHERVDESLILGSIVCAACVAYAAGPVLNTDFMKNVGAGIGGLLSGIGGMFGGISGMFGLGGGSGSTKIDDIKAILKKKPGDMTGKEKELLEKVKNDPKLQKELSANELKSLDGALSGKGEEDEDKKKEEQKKEDGISADDNKKLQALLKKKPEDLSPRERRELKELSSKYNLKDELSPKDWEKFKATGANKPSQEEISAGLMALAAKANESEKDPDKKAKNQALLDIVTASAYDDDGSMIPMSERQAKMKELVGEDNWDSFEKDLKEMEKNVNTDDFKSALEDAKKNLTDDDIKTMMENQKKTAKEASTRIKKENEEKAKIEKEIEDLKKDPNADPKKIEELEGKRDELINNSTMGKASPNTAKAAIERAKSKKEEPKKDDKEESKEEPKKDDKEESKEEPKKDEEKQLKKEKAEVTDKIKDVKQEKKKETDEEKLKKLEAQLAKLQKKKEKLSDSIKASLEKEEKETSKEDKKSKKDLLKDEGLLNNVKKAWGKDTDGDSKEEPKKDKNGNVLKQEKVTDPETGKKIEVTTHTGPRGGKFYYRKGKPETPQNKVYVKEENEYTALSNYLMEQINA